MERISINLLPQEFISEQIQKTRFYKIQSAGIFVILTMIFLSILVVSLRVLQSSQLNTAGAKASEAEQRVTNLAARQSSLIFLKDRLLSIGQSIGVSSKQAGMYALINELLPQPLSVNQISIGVGGEVLFSATTSNLESIDQLIEDLLDKERNEDKISSVAIEALNRGRDGIYRISFKIVAK